MTLIRPVGTILPCADATISISPRHAHAERQDEQEDDRRADRTTDRRRWRLDDLERRRQERQLVGAPFRLLGAPGWAPGSEEPEELDRRLNRLEGRD